MPAILVHITTISLFSCYSFSLYSILLANFDRWRFKIWHSLLQALCFMSSFVLNLSFDSLQFTQHLVCVLHVALLCEPEHEPHLCYYIAIQYLHHKHYVNRMHYIDIGIVYIRRNLLECFFALLFFLWFDNHGWLHITTFDGVCICMCVRVVWRLFRTSSFHFIYFRFQCFELSGDSRNSIGLGLFCYNLLLVMKIQFVQYLCYFFQSFNCPFTFFHAHFAKEP